MYKKNLESQIELNFKKPELKAERTKVDLTDKHNGSCTFFNVQYGEQKFKIVSVTLKKNELEIILPRNYSDEFEKEILELADIKIKTQNILPKGFNPKKQPPKNWQDNY
jgi:hypothetical protein